MGVQGLNKKKKRFLEGIIVWISIKRSIKTLKTQLLKAISLFPRFHLFLTTWSKIRLTKRSLIEER